MGLRWETQTQQVRDEILRFADASKAEYEAELTARGIQLPSPYILDYLLVGSYVNGHASANSDIDILFLIPPYRAYPSPQHEDIKNLKVNIFIYKQRNYNLPTVINYFLTPVSQVFHPPWKIENPALNVAYSLTQNIYFKNQEDVYAHYKRMIRWP